MTRYFTAEEIKSVPAPVAEAMVASNKAYDEANSYGVDIMEYRSNCRLDGWSDNARRTVERMERTAEGLYATSDRLYKIAVRSADQFSTIGGVKR